MYDIRESTLAITKHTNKRSMSIIEMSWLVLIFPIEWAQSLIVESLCSQWTMVFALHIIIFDPRLAITFDCLYTNAPTNTLATAHHWTSCDMVIEWATHGTPLTRRKKEEHCYHNRGGIRLHVEHKSARHHPMKHADI